MLDITDRKRAEEALQKALDGFEPKVRERTRELRQADERLRLEVEKHKRTEGALRESGAKCKTLVETSPDAVVLADLQGDLTFVSRGALKLGGDESVEEFSGKHWLDLWQWKTTAFSGECEENTRRGHNQGH